MASGAHNGKRRRLYNKITSKFLDLSAQVDDNESSSDDETTSDEEGFFVNDWDKSNGRFISQTHMLPNTMDDEGEAERMVSELRERARNTRYDGVDTADILEDTQIRENEFRKFFSCNLNDDTQSGLRLLLIPTKCGVETKVAAELNDILHAPCKAFSSPLLCGRIYVLTGSFHDISRAVRRIDTSTVRFSSTKYVPYEDRIPIMRLLNTKNDIGNLLPVGSWVRFKNGSFKNDVGYVWKTLGSDFIRVAIVPRMWDESSTTLKRKLDGNGRVLKRPPHRLLTAERLEMFDKKRITPGADEDTIRLDEEMYLKKGLRLIDVFSVHAVTPTRPNAYEVSVFTQLRFNTREITNKTFLSVGDTVEVVAGNLSGYAGIVESIPDSGICQIRALEQSSQIASYMVPLGDIERSFEVGDSVIVEIGWYSGHIGSVVALSEEKLTIIDDSTTQEFNELKAFVKTHRIQNHSIGGVNLSAIDDVLDRPSLLIQRLVYVPMLSKIGRISHVVKDGGYVVVDGLQPRTSHPSNCNRFFNAFALGEVVDVSKSAYLNGSKFRDDGRMKATLSTFVDRHAFSSMVSTSLGKPREVKTISVSRETTFSALVKQSHPQPYDPQSSSPLRTSPTKGIDGGEYVYVLHRNVKRFGSLVALNGNNHAVVIPDGRRDPQPFDLDKVLSVRDRHRLDNHEAHGMDTIFSKYDDNNTEQHNSVLHPLLTSEECFESRNSIESDECDWILDPTFEKVMSEYHIFFRFIEHCVCPGNVGGALAWTLRETSTRIVKEYLPNGKNRNRTDIYLCYRSHEGRQFLSWVPLRSLENCQPKASEKSLVVRGPESGKIMATEKFERNKQKAKTGVLLRVPGGKKRDVVRFSFSDVTRVVEYNSSLV